MSVGALGLAFLYAIFVVPVGAALAMTLWLIFRRKERVKAALIDKDGEIPVVAWWVEVTPWWKR